ncbi:MULTISPECIES: ATP-binding protein [unclassified Streptomyces]|uniref:ATP-binding protein n=1 Tax=unclassified Streptomyces TaxID=2593676 RepID=UPI002ED45ACA|nr:ATP-binding protein [Streptomyces sp. NBC_00891]WSY07487.1 ATP-binding protein [Streptomyces sp. NBC_00890]WSZ09112.1 ATP-binding protein [Streptomyces sp. NBC_00869]WSZ23389.1 ATP-binding protein [Streptomyces sp. NBC_00870]
MRVSPLTALCPAAAGTSYAPPPRLHPKGRSGSGLGLSFTLPGGVRSASIARTATAVALEAHGLTAYVWPVSHAVNELVSVTARLSPGRELYVSLRHREDAVRLLVWDQHPHHVEPDTAALCEVRRRRALWLLAAVVDDWGGEWGVCEAPQPMRGTKSWVTLPR